MNNDYKILATILRNRISDILDKIISKEQIGFMKNRNIETNIWLINSVYASHNIGLQSHAMIFYDLEKAYDYVNHEALVYIMKKRGFGNLFTKLIHTLHSSATARIITSNGVTDIIYRKSGVFQGCPLAPLLFNIVADLIAVHFKSTINDPNQRILQYADDTAFVVKSASAASIANQCMEEYVNAIGGKINFQKSEAINLGINDNKQQLPNQFTWQSSAYPLIYLGIPFG